MRFKGQLLVPSEPGPGLRVDLEVAGHHLAVESDGADLGAWPLDAVRVRRLEGDTFAMTVAGEDLHFVADDTISFAYTAIPAIEQVSGPGTSRSRFRNWLGRLSPEPAAKPERKPDPAPKTAAIDIPVKVDEPPDSLPDWLDRPPADAEIEMAAVTSEIPSVEDEVIDVSVLWEEIDEPSASPLPEPLPTAAPEREPTVETCRGRTADSLPCRSPILSSSGYCYAHDPERSVDDGYRKAQEARARLKRRGTAKLNRVYSRLDKAMRQVERGELEPDIAVAMAQLARTMCAILDLDEDDEADEG